eukprot:GHVU01084529.1.p1 GENE.GHVU01084529.1~~GHVU01084529.1.p1  ORF type:complete len:117 (-),score=19.54 GHVU01084529.1:59-409(-)
MKEETGTGKDKTMWGKPTPLLEILKMEEVSIKAYGKYQEPMTMTGTVDDDIGNFGILTAALTEAAAATTGTGSTSHEVTKPRNDDDKGRFHSAANASGINDGIGSGVLSIGKSEWY